MIKSQSLLVRRGELVTAFQLIFLAIRVRMEGLQPCLEEAVAAPGSLDAGDRFLNAVDGLKVLALGVDEEISISHLEEHLGEELVSRDWDVMLDI